MPSRTVVENIFEELDHHDRLCPPENLERASPFGSHTTATVMARAAYFPLREEMGGISYYPETFVDSCELTGTVVHETGHLRTVSIHSVSMQWFDPMSPEGLERGDWMYLLGHTVKMHCMESTTAPSSRGVQGKAMEAKMLQIEEQDLEKVKKGLQEEVSWLEQKIKALEAQSSSPSPEMP